MKKSLLEVLTLIVIILTATMLFPMPPVMYGIMIGSITLCIIVIVALYCLKDSENH